MIRRELGPWTQEHAEETIKAAILIHNTYKNFVEEYIQIDSDKQYIQIDNDEQIIKRLCEIITDPDDKLGYKGRYVHDRDK